MISKEEQAMYLKENVQENMDTVALIKGLDNQLRIEECSWDYELEDGEEVLSESFAPNPEIVEQDHIENIIDILSLEDYYE